MIVPAKTPGGGAVEGAKEGEWTDETGSSEEPTSVRITGEPSQGMGRERQQLHLESVSKEVVSLEGKFF